MKRYIFLCLLAWLTASCSNFLEEYSQDLARIKNYGDLDELLIGDGYWRPATVYTERSAIKIKGDFYLMPLHLMSDETEIYRKCDADFAGLDLQGEFFGYIAWQQQVGRNYKGTVINAEDKAWNELYKRINIANQVIGDIDKQSASNEKEILERMRVKGEAHFLRAIYYFTLVNMYAEPYCSSKAAETPGIPVKLTQQIEDKEYRTASLAEVYRVILDDLSEARACLSRTEIKNHPYRADIVAAQLLTSRVYLYMQEWQNAYNYADSVICRKGALVNLNYRNENDTSDFLNRSSVETVFSMGGHLLAPALYRRKGMTKAGQPFDYPAWIIPENLVALYGEENDDSDLRRGVYIRCITPIINSSKGSPVWVYNKINGPRRYTNGQQASEVGDVFLMRTAEAYLNGAEAAAQLGKTSDAHRLLQHLRTHRVKSERDLYGSGAELVRFVREERERELCLEGHRWFDLRRYMVDMQYPFTKQIVHYHADFNTETADGRYETMCYVLDENDPAYTLALPLEVREFQNTLPSVLRPDRAGVIHDDFADLDLTTIGYEDGYKSGCEAGVIDKEKGNKWVNTSSNANYKLYYNVDYSVLSDYKSAYKKGFAAGYKEAYPEKK